MSRSAKGYVMYAHFHELFQEELGVEYSTGLWESLPATIQVVWDRLAELYLERE